MANIVHGTRNTYSLSNDSRSESLCDGIAKRLFKNIKGYQDHQFSEKPGHEFICDFKLWLQTLQSKRLGRKKAIGQVLSMFNQTFWNEGISACKDKSSLRLYGAVHDDDCIYLVISSVDLKKPHRTSIAMMGIGLTKHVLSRVLFRLKPADLMWDLKCLTSTITELIRVCHNKSDAKLWVILPDIGGFVVETFFVDSTEQFYGKIITFVDQGLLSRKQISLGLIQWKRYELANPISCRSSLGYINDLKSRDATGRTNLTNVMISNR